MKMKLEVGKQYVRYDGIITEPCRYDISDGTDNCYVCNGPEGFIAYKENGECCIDWPDVNIVSEYGKTDTVTTGKFQTGETYTTASGQKVKCIHIENGLVYCSFIYESEMSNTAYTWDMEGVYQNAPEHQRGEYRIKFEPVAEVKYQFTTIEGHPVTIKYTTKDGVLDEGSITAEVAPF